jgi:hypothetical protein
MIILCSKALTELARFIQLKETSKRNLTPNAKR